MIHLIKSDPQVQLEPEESVYEFGYYTFDILPDMENKEQSKNTEKIEICAINEAILTQDENIPLALPNKEKKILLQADAFCKPTMTI